MNSTHDEIRVAESEERLRTITDNLPVVIAYIDRDHRYQFCNKTFEQWGGPKPDEIDGMKMLDVLGKGGYELRIPYLRRAMDGERVEFEFAANGRNLQSVYIPHTAHDGAVEGIYTLTSDITRLKNIERELLKMARFDSLTGLINGHSLGEMMPEAISRSKRTQLPLALIFLDVDRFKHIKDAFGHAAGDRVLKEFADRLKSCVRVADTVARLAGDEFVVILEGLHARQEAEAISEKIIATVSATPFSVSGLDTLHITAIIGTAMFYPEQEIGPAALLARAGKRCTWPRIADATGSPYQRYETNAEDGLFDWPRLRTSTPNAKS